MSSAYHPEARLPFMRPYHRRMSKRRRERWKCHGRARGNCARRTVIDDHILQAVEAVLLFSVPETARDMPAVGSLARTIHLLLTGEPSGEIEPVMEALRRAVRSLRRSEEKG